MTDYLIRRLFLLPLTLFAIILVNFVILNLVPGDPVNVADRSHTGDLTRSADMEGSMEENHHLQFREHYGLTLPILFNHWYALDEKKVDIGLQQLATKKRGDKEMSVQDYHLLRTRWGDRARFVMPILLKKAQDPHLSLIERGIAANLFIRGGTKQGFVGTTLSKEKRQVNRAIAASNQELASLRFHAWDSNDKLEGKVGDLAKWYNEAGGEASFTKQGVQKLATFFLETRFFRYLGRVTLLDFGTLRNDSNKTVISEVSKRMKYSLALAVVPMVLTFGLCQLFGMIMAVKHNQWPDITLNLFFLILF
ncbi:MAG: ABC transporter permease, partial [Chlamydiales bacterium]